MKTSHLLHGEVPYALRMAEIMDASREGGDPVVDGLLHRPEYRPPSS